MAPVANIPVEVRFKQGSYWSKGYTYLSDREYAPLTLVLLPSSDGFYTVGEVVKSKPGTPLVDGIKYKRIIKEIEINENH